jgi:hypothetical protein
MESDDLGTVRDGHVRVILEVKDFDKVGIDSI